MSLKERIQEEMKAAMRAKDKPRLECLRMAKGAIMVREKSGGGEVTGDDEIAVLRAEVRKRQQTLAILREHGKTEEATATELEIATIEEFLPGQLSREQVDGKVAAYLAEHPEVTHAGKLTGALKKELGDAVDGKVLNESCRAALGS